MNQLFQNYLQRNLLIKKINRQKSNKILNSCMTTQEKSAKKATKFNYLAEDGIKQKLLGRYENQNASQNICKRTYGTHSSEKNKQTAIQNLHKDIINASKLNHNGINRSFDLSSKYLNHQLHSFGKSRPDGQKSEIFKQNSTEISKNQRAFIKENRNINNNQNVQRIRNKSYENISLKKHHLQNTGVRNNKNRFVEFSPYREETDSFKYVAQNSDKKDRLKDSNRYDNSRLNESHQNLLIYEMEEQQFIIRKQLKQYEYQNELLRQKIQYLQTDNSSFKQITQKYISQMQSQQTFYQQQICKQTINMKQLEQEILALKSVEQNMQISITEQKYLIVDLEHQINSITLQVKDLQMILVKKDDIIFQLKKQIQIIPTQKLNHYQGQINQRRKSLDLSTRGRTIHDQIKSAQLRKISLQKYNSVQLNDNIKMQNTTSTNMGRLMNKKNTYESNPRQDLKTIQKQLNLIDSIKSMYFKITNKEVKDLKQLWKWLKQIAHQYQSFSQLYSLRDSIENIMNNYQARQSSQKLQRQLSFIDEECYKIIKKMNQIVIKAHS